MSAAKKEKPGKVVRLDPAVWRLVSAERTKGETITGAIRRLLGLTRAKTRKLYVLPSDLSESVEEARGRAVLVAVKRKMKPEKPIAVRIES